MINVGERLIRFLYCIVNLQISLWAVKGSGAAEEMFDPIDEVRIEL